MAYNTKSIKKDVDGKPIPQIFDMVKDDYEVLQGRNGAQRVEIYGPDGNPLSTTGGKIAVKASELETLLTALGGKDFATQTTLAAVLAKLSSDPATQTTLAAILSTLQGELTTTLTGSSPGTIPEYGWLDTDDEPTPLEPTKLAFGVEINTTTHAMTTKYWNGTVWQEVL